ncbi:MAG: FISUMP domain-containing protein [Bacteroidales bacterium]
MDTIGDKIWLRENLKTTHYRNGSPIPNVIDSSWSSLHSGAYSWYCHDTADWVTHGALYNWFTISDPRKLCPTGWHVPSLEEMQPNIDYFGRYSNGSRLPDGAFTGKGAGYYWVNWEIDSVNALLVDHSNYSYREDGKMAMDKRAGLSVRCLKGDYNPVILLTSLTDITTNSATCNVEIHCNNEDDFKVEGVCYALKPNPTIQDQMVEIDSYVRFYKCPVSNLLPDKLYYVRPFIIASDKVYYGNEMKLKTYKRTIIDGDGNEYFTVKIGTQEWMAANLKTGKFSDGSAIPNITDDITWRKLTHAAFCWYNNDELKNKTYGALYNYYAITDNRNLCPTGWYVASREDWRSMETQSQSMDPDQGGKFISTIYWDTFNSGITNESGFSATMGGLRGTNEEWINGFQWMSEFGFWWTLMDFNCISGFYQSLRRDGSIYAGSEKKRGMGLSVRCLQDSAPMEISTRSFFQVTTSSITCESVIKKGADKNIICRGVCYSKIPNPDISNNTTDDGTGKGYFSSLLDQLEPNTKYYVRAYAKTEDETLYGNEIAIKTFNSSVSDIDGNVYNTVIIGSQEWMAENLRTTKYSNGEPIELAGSSQWDWTDSKTTGIYAWSSNGEEQRRMCGAIYNFYAVVNPGNLCPAGWHVPNNSEWDSLVNYLGGPDVAGGKLKSTTQWLDYVSEHATNESGFNALPGITKPDFGGGAWWSSSEYDVDQGYDRMLFPNYFAISTYYPWKYYGLSVRCIKN